MRSYRFVFALAVGLILMQSAAPAAEAPYSFGFAKANVTPTVPVRLSGYGNRSEPFEGIDESLFARVMVIKPNGGTSHVLVSVDTIGFPGVLTKEIHERIEEQHGIPRECFVLACTHSHTAPHVGRGLSNLFSTPLSDDEREQTEAYTDFLRDQIIAAVGDALHDLSPGRLFVGAGEAHFAVNRRVLQDGKWTGFGINPGGSVDHSLPVLKITDASGETIRAVVFNYACHCTTFGGDYNRVNGDWAGYAARYLEESHPGALALCTIGCGADANPQRVPDRALQIAQAQGREIADEVERVTTEAMTEITEPLQANYGFAGLPIDRPAVEQLREALNDNRPQVRRHAEEMLDIHQRMGRLPETYPMPIQVWRFGDQFVQVFLGGEVCVDYAFRIRDELPAEDASSALSSQPSALVWVTAYANDVFGYVAPERMRDEGGYEVDYSMIYYLQPGRWSSGTEDVILRRVHELYDNSLPAGPLSPEDALQSFTLPDGFSIDVVAAEPLIADPVNFSVGPDGRLWVAEMGDYPRGAHDDGAPGGRVQVLTDVDGDGRYDEAVTFLDELTYPTGVFPWRGGALITAAPDILYAEDTDGDGRADHTEVLYTGFVESNPQHRINGFCYGLDNWLYLGSGASSGDITSVRTGEVVNVSGRDSRILPDAGLIEALSGETQYGRVRDDWGNWFGNSNSRPLFHFVMPDRYLRRNPYVAAPHPLVNLTNPPVAPPVYPTSRTVDRFNDLFAEDRFTSACSPTVFRDRTLGEDVHGAVLICEPVHNLVSRLMLEPDGVTFTAHRHPDEHESEFLSSRDNWFRPTRLATGPDGALWVADMYRMVIEHPQWIPEAWQERLNLYAGNDRGRIYRVYRTETPPNSIPNLAAMGEPALVEQLGHANGWRRDNAQMLLVQQPLLDDSTQSRLEQVVEAGDSPLARLHALCVLDGRHLLRQETLLIALADKHPCVVRQAVRVSERFLAEGVLPPAALPDVSNGDARVRFQTALALGEADGDRAPEILARIAAENVDHPWMRAAVLSSASRNADVILTELLKIADPSEGRTRIVADLVATALGDDPQSGVVQMIATIAEPGTNEPEDWQLLSLAECLNALQRRRVTIDELADSESPEVSQALSQMDALVAAARQIAINENADIQRRVAAAGVLARGRDQRHEDRELLASWLSPRERLELQTAAVESLSDTGADDVPALLLSEWSGMLPQLKGQILHALLSREPWTQELLAALEKESVGAAELDAAARDRLTEHSLEEIRTAATKLLGAPTSEDRRKVIDDYTSATELTGDPTRGATVFKKRCATCHRHKEIGNDIGAKLSALQDKSPQSLLTALLDPNRAVEGKYMAYSVVTQDGRVFSGMIVEETATSVTLAKPDGTKEVILRVDIDEIAGTGKSFMPEGLEKDLSPQDIADVISFLR
ncbi:MAG: dehydrogenase [Planctomycetota bacterium]|nr:MAG: dehydrogenase [Planctomycetota bacterium]REK22004.1 MAG: dehydrogenase [Planctomycetota bacterium]REK31248.1 MAG: dehydrogenase [Planctomycetota bacterium]